MAFGDVIRSGSHTSSYLAGTGGDSNTIWNSIEMYVYRIYEHSTTDFSVIRSAGTGGGYIGAGGDSNTIWSCYVLGTVYELSTADFSVIRSAGSAINLGIGGDSSTIWATTAAGSVYELSTVDFSVIRSEAGPTGGYNEIGGDSNTIWYCNWVADYIYELSTTDFSVIRYVQSPTPTFRGIGGDSNTIWSTDNNKIYELDSAIMSSPVYTTLAIVKSQLAYIPSSLEDVNINMMIIQAEGLIDGIMKKTGRIATTDFTFDADKHGLIRLATTMLACHQVLSTGTEEYKANSYASLTGDLYWQLWELCSELLSDVRVVDYLINLSGSDSTPKYTAVYIVREQIQKNINLNYDEIEIIIILAEGVIDAIMKKTGRVATTDFTFDANKHGLIRLATTMLSCFIIVSSNVEMYVSTSHAALTADLYWKSFINSIEELADVRVVDYLISK